jgi:BolA protein
MAEVVLTNSVATPIKTNIVRKLTHALAPSTLEVTDQSHQHAHHGHVHAHHGSNHKGGETHFSVEIVSAAFEGKSRIERHRLITMLLAQELAERVHALSIAAKTPAEAKAN